MDDATKQQIREKLEAMDKAMELFHKTCMVMIVGQQQLIHEIKHLLNEDELPKATNHDRGTH